MTDMRPVAFFWDKQEGVMTPMHRHRPIAEKQFEDGKVYILQVVDDKSSRSMRHFHASVRDCWLNLPHGLSERFPDQEFLRKHALCHTGFADERTVVCTSRDQAHQFAALCRTLDRYAVITIKDKIVRIFTARSQAAMDHAEFQKSKTACLDYLASLIGVDPATLAAQNPQHLNGPRVPEPPRDDVPPREEIIP
jgi:hypothetical protein